MRVNSIESMMWPRISRVSLCGSGVEAMAPRCGSRLADGRLWHAHA
jgi:hypothetical protein